MRRWFVAAALAVGMPALAGPLQEQTTEVARKQPGLVVIEATKPGQCTGAEDGWSDPTVAARLGSLAVSAYAVPWTKGNLDPLVGKGVKANELRFAYKDGVELDRVCGCMGGPALLGWLEGLAAGRTLAGAHREALLALPLKPYPLDGWLTLLQEDFCADRLGEAFATAKQLWSEIPKLAPERRDVRLTRLVRDIGVLLRRDPAIKAEVVALRDGLDAAKDQDVAALDDWVALNRILGSDDKTYAWFSAKQADPASKVLVDHLAPNVFWMLTEDGRWAEAGAVVGDPEAWLGLWRDQFGGLEGAVRTYAALSAAKRTKDAAALAKGVLGVDPKAACQLLGRATEVGAVDAKQAPVAKKCADAAVVEAWSGKLK